MRLAGAGREARLGDEELEWIPRGAGKGVEGPDPKVGVGARV